MRFSIIKEDTHTAARAGVIETSRGSVATPVFMPVATHGAIRALSTRDVEEIGFELVLANTYHLYLRPGLEILAAAGGLHRFMDFAVPMLTDSGGFQVFSLADFCRVREHGVEFRSHIDGSRHFFTPAGVLDAQGTIGSDIMMVLDQCVAYPAERKAAAEAVERTVRWAAESAAHWRATFDAERQASFAIMQGSVYPDLRRDCAARLVDLDFPGYAIGGLSVGESKEEYRDMTALSASLLPADRPRYIMGVGSPAEILAAVEAGVDMCDCVMPTRIARNGTLYTTAGRLSIKAARYAADLSPVDQGCGCYVCRRFTRAYLRHLFRSGEIAGLIYNTYHNLWFMKRFMERVRESVLEGRFREEARHWLDLYGRDAACISP